MNAPRHAITLGLALLAACAGGPPPPAWQFDAKAAVEDAVEARLAGDERAADAAMTRARSAVARTGRPALAARIELMRCAADTASLDFAPCTPFERWAADAEPAERAYADHLAGLRLAPDAIAALPEAQRAAAAAIAAGRAAPAAVAATEDPLSRLVGIALLFRAGLADPAMIRQAADISSAQGWRRPLLAWLGVQAHLAERAGDAAEAARLRRRIDLASGS